MIRRSVVATAICLTMFLTGCNRKESSAADNKVKIGFIVKQPEEQWFQLEWQFAQQAADKDGFTLVKLPGPDAEQVMAAIDDLAAQGAKGFVICTPDVRLGTAIAGKAKSVGLKVLTVDDQFVGSDGKFMADVPHLGISAKNIGRMVGKSLYDEFKKRGWNAGDTGVCVVTFEELETAKDRTDGAIEALTEAGFPQDRIFKTPQRTSDVEGGFNATSNLLTQQPTVKHWLICGMNDSAVIGAVRAMEGRGLTAADVCGIGINGTDCLGEFRAAKPTGFFASILLTPKRHGYETADMMYKWITAGTEPPKATYTDGILITRDNYESVMKEQGLLQ